MDDLVFDDDEVELSQQEQTPPEKSQPFKDLRRAYNALEKEAKELRAFQEAVNREKSEAATTSVFTELGVDPKRAKYWRVDNPDAEPTKENISGWAIAEGFLAPESVEQSPPTQAGFTPTVVTGGPIDAKVYTAEELMDLYARDPEQVKALYQKGRVQLEKLPGGMTIG